MRFSSHNLGTRKIRSAGRRSGSVVVTLPAELAGLEGLDCTVALEGGETPVLVLRPRMEGLTRILRLACAASETGLYGPGPLTSWRMDRLHVVAGVPKPLIENGQVQVGLGELATLQGGEAFASSATGGPFSSMVRAILATVALTRGFGEEAARDYATVLASLVTGSTDHIDLFSLDMMAAVQASRPPGIAITRQTICSVESWASHAGAAAQLAREFIPGPDVAGSGRHRRADWSTASRFARLAS